MHQEREDFPHVSAGDEFAVIQTDAEALPDAGALADALIADLSRPFEIDGFCIHIGASVGIVQAPEHGPDFERLMINADLALYRAKAAGKNVWRALLRIWTKKPELAASWKKILGPP